MKELALQSTRFGKLHRGLLSHVFGEDLKKSELHIEGSIEGLASLLAGKTIASARKNTKDGKVYAKGVSEESMAELKDKLQLLSAQFNGVASKSQRRQLLAEAIELLMEDGYEFPDLLPGRGKEVACLRLRKGKAPTQKATIAYQASEIERLKAELKKLKKG